MYINNLQYIVNFVFTDVPAPWIVLEYLHNGDLKSFLSKNKRPLTKLVKYMVDVSMGMHYISEKGLIHRVSTRGCCVVILSITF